MPTHEREKQKVSGFDSFLVGTLKIKVHTHTNTHTHHTHTLIMIYSDFFQKNKDKNNSVLANNVLRSFEFLTLKKAEWRQLGTVDLDALCELFFWLSERGARAAPPRAVGTHSKG